MRKIILITVASLFWLSISYAQNIPQGNQPGAESARFESQAEKKKAFLEKKDVKKPEIVVEKKEQKLSEKGPVFLLKKINLTGYTVFTKEQLEPLYNDYIGKKFRWKIFIR